MFEEELDAREVDGLDERHTQAEWAHM